MSKSGKTNKSYTKRLRRTKTGKILARKVGHGHYNAKASGRKNLKKHGTQNFAMKNKDIGRAFPNS